MFEILLRKICLELDNPYLALDTQQNISLVVAKCYRRGDRVQNKRAYQLVVVIPNL